MQFSKRNDLKGDSKKMADLIELRFKNINQASKEIKFTRTTIYSWIKAGKLTDITKDILRGRGFDPETLLKVSGAAEPTG
ncbi:hypothetical protein KAR91_05610 [Candidatus Pacearchaeota archaeon]|nr:hypothetical protein [Candidatus Pacearchaeota archaeon]